MILLDTHVLFWWIRNPSKLSPKAKKEMASPGRGKNLYVSSISIWEIAQLVRKKRINLDVDVSEWVKKLEKIEALRFIPIDNKIALKSVELDWSHKDPADRIIIATALQLGAKLITSDQRILKYKQVQTIW